jgi:hypothetical protein
MKKRTIKLFKYSELTEKYKNKVRTQLKYNFGFNDDIYCPDTIYDKYQKLLKKFGMTLREVHFIDVWGSEYFQNNNYRGFSKHAACFETGNEYLESEATNIKTFFKEFGKLFNHKFTSKPEEVSICSLFHVEVYPGAYGMASIQFEGNATREDDAFLKNHLEKWFMTICDNLDNDLQKWISTFLDKEKMLFYIHANKIMCEKNGKPMVCYGDDDCDDED